MFIWTWNWDWRACEEIKHVQVSTQFSNVCNKPNIRSWNTVTHHFRLMFRDSVGCEIEPVLTDSFKTQELLYLLTCNITHIWFILSRCSTRFMLWRDLKNVTERDTVSQSDLTWCHIPVTPGAHEHRWQCAGDVLQSRSLCLTPDWTNDSFPCAMRRKCKIIILVSERHVTTAGRFENSVT